MKSISSMYRACAIIISALALAACSHSSSPAGGSVAASADAFFNGKGGGGKTYTVCDQSTFQKDALIAVFDAHEGDTIQFCEGVFNFTTGLTLTGKRGITIKGAGINKTVLSFKNSDAQDGININRVTGIVVQDMTIYDAPGNGLRIFRSEFVTVRGVKVGWSDADDHCPTAPTCPNYDASMASWVTNGSYAFYPVLSHHIFIENSVSVGSSDAGVYVGQSNDILVQNTEAYHNVAGFEFENTFRAEFIHNVAHDNVAGFLIFDLPGRAQFGEKNVVHFNESYSNNIPSFAPRGAIVGDVPSGTGILVLASDQLEVHDNNVHNNNMSGLIIVNYGLIDNSEPSTNYDFFPEGIHAYNNTFTDNGGNPPPPDLSKSSCHGLVSGLPGLLPSTVLGPLGGILSGLPGISDLNNPECITNNASLLATILVAKNLGKSAQIIWDGARDVPNDSCTDYPKDRYGVPLNQPDAKDVDRYEPREDERGRPNLYIYDPQPSCKYNKWKFDDKGVFKLPQNGICIQNNTFNKTQAQTLLVDDFLNVKFPTADLSNVIIPVDHTQPQECPTLSPTLIATELSPRLSSFTPNPANDPHPSTDKLAQVCGGGRAGQINYAALASYNCSLLSNYGLFKDQTDPTQGASGPGVPYDLNTILFSDYATKYRFLFLPLDGSGNVQKATYQDHLNCETLTIYNCYTATLGFPVGTTFAKTFSFRNGANEQIVETRLLIKRQDASGRIEWVGLPFEWQVDAKTGKRTDAALKLEGDTKAVTYDYDDPDPAAVDSTGKRLHYSGKVDAYGIPNAGACLQCHAGDDREPGAAPIGPKVRNLNKDHTYEDGSTINQLTYLHSKGMLDLPDDPTKLEKMAKWNVPGSTGEVANSPADIHKRVRTFMEVNCMHCHNPAGGAQNSGLSLDAFDAIDNGKMGEGHGICKPPIAAGRAADVGDYDIQPGNASQSVLPYRISSVAPGIRMPPLARTVQDSEFVTAVNNWTNSVVSGFADPAANTCGQSVGLPISLMMPLSP